MKEDSNSAGQRTGLILNDIFLRHFKQVEHPESPIRLLAIESEIRRRGLLSQLKLTPIREASCQELELVHDAHYIEALERACEEAAHPLTFHDAWICPQSYRVASAAVGSALEMARMISSKEIRNGFAAIRPPGHHAERDRYVGFCYFCTPAIVGKFLIKEMGYERVFILDLDYHGGNGTQHALEDDPQIFYCSIHCDPRVAFPHDSGYTSERGLGPGHGFTKNVVLAPEIGNIEYISTFESEIAPEILRYRPDFIVVSLGFDILDLDPIGRFNLTLDAISEITDKLCGIADEVCDGRLISLLEGGYHINATAQGVATHLEGLLKYS